MYLGIPEIYFDNFFEVADEIGKIYNRPRDNIS